MLNKLKKINHKQKLELVASFTQKIMDSQPRKMCGCKEYEEKENR